MTEQRKRGRPQGHSEPEHVLLQKINAAIDKLPHDQKITQESVALMLEHSTSIRNLQNWLARIKEALDVTWQQIKAAGIERREKREEQIAD